MKKPIANERGVTVYHGDSLQIIAQLPAESVGAVVTDPPYGIEFMGREWDRFRRDDVDPASFTRRRGSMFAPPTSLAFQEWCRQWALEVMRVLKPGGHMLAFGATRMHHRLAAGVEDAGFEIRDTIAWLYGGGFPKSLDVAKAIDKSAGHWRGRRGAATSTNNSMSAPNYARTDKGEPVTVAARAWDGWGTALKPAFEPVVVARKPLVGTVAQTVLEYGTGALNIDGARVPHRDGDDLAESLAKNPGRDDLVSSGVYGGNRPQQSVDERGRWPANVALDDEAGRLLDDFSPGASRFFYSAKADAGDRLGSTHPTVKPVDLMRWLVRLVTPPDGVVLDPFAGTGTTGQAAIDESRRAILIEREADYLPDILRRLRGWGDTRGTLLVGDAS